MMWSLTQQRKEKKKENPSLWSDDAAEKYIQQTYIFS